MALRNRVASCCGSESGAKNSGGVTAFQIQGDVVNYNIENTIYGGADMSEREYETLRSALASTRMEGFEVTEQTEKDCVRLMSGEVSVDGLVKEIMARPAKAV